MKHPLILITVLCILLFNACQSRELEDDRTKVIQVEARIDTVQLLKGEWLQPIPGSDSAFQGFVLQDSGFAFSVNMATLLYQYWQYNSGKLSLVSESIGNKSVSTDTLDYEILKIDQGALELKSKYGADKYFRR